MKKFALIGAGTALALAATAAFASGTVSPAETQRGEARLARMIAGRTPGQPVSCISTGASRNLEVISGVAVVYNAGSTVYVARPTDPHMLGGSDALVIDRFSGAQLCVQEPMKTIDRYDHYTTGVVFLQDFVPYTRTR